MYLVYDNHCNRCFFDSEYDSFLLLQLYMYEYIQHPSQFCCLRLRKGFRRTLVMTLLSISSLALTSTKVFLTYPEFHSVQKVMQSAGSWLEFPLEYSILLSRVFFQRHDFQQLVFLYNYCPQNRSRLETTIISRLFHHLPVFRGRFIT